MINVQTGVELASRPVFSDGFLSPLKLNIENLVRVFRVPGHLNYWNRIGGMDFKYESTPWEPYLPAEGANFSDVRSRYHTCCLSMHDALSL
jgi:hypothetical protein